MDDALTRGVAAIYPSREAFQEALQKKPLTIYWGVDPTAPNLHLGHLALLLKLRDFQQLGHKIIIVLGDFTARIGDPTDKSAVRTRLSADEVKKNLTDYRRQIGLILDSTTVFKTNSQWLAKLGLVEVIDLVADFTVAQMVERDMFQRRLASGQPIYLHEFLYPLLQGYDSVALGVDVEVGATDQTFNMLIGRTMLKKHGREKFVLTHKLLVDSRGEKMSKTAGNMVALNELPHEMYGQIMSWPDEMVPQAFELLTRAPLSSIASELSQPLQAKKKLALAVVTLCHSLQSALEAENYFAQTFQHHEIPETLPEFVFGPEQTLLDAVVVSGVVASKTEFRRLLAAGAIVNLTAGNQVVTDGLQILTTDTVLRIGKKRFLKLVGKR